MKKLKIALIGAGSATFGRGAICDILSSEELREFSVTLILVDIDEAALKRMHGLSLLVKKHFRSPAKIQASTNRREVLKDADYVIVSVSVNRWSLWEKDFYLPAVYGFRHVFGENGGPGAAFHALRSLKITLPIAKDMEDLCPDALLINYTNPESRVCLAVSQLTKVRVVGLCHGAFGTQRHVGRILEKDPADIDLTIGGLNHFHWALKIQDRKTGTDLKPDFDRKMKKSDHGFFPLVLKLYHLFGYLPYPAPSHIGEYISFAHEEAGPVLSRWGIGAVSQNETDTAKTLEFELDDRTGTHSYHLWSMEQGKKIMEISEGRAPLTEEYTKPSGELAVPIICDIEFNRNRKELSVNVPNFGRAISNLPEDAVIEVSAMVDQTGVHPIAVGPLPEAIAGICQNQISIQKLLVQAYAEKSRHLLFQALCIDPCIDSMARAEQFMNHMIRLQSNYLPELQ